MRLLTGRAAALVMGAGLFIGVLASTAPTGAATLPLLSTTTVASVAPATGDVTTATATVSLELVGGLLVTPSGEVTFTEYANGYLEGSRVTLAPVPLSRCLLGLPALTGITQATCSATVSLVHNGFCFVQEITASYTGATDLIAKPSVGAVIVNRNTPSALT